ncbi:unnamed protein product, partial [Rotaria socialis]
DVHRCRLLRRGIPAQPILNGYCGNYEVVFELICVIVITSSDIEFLAVRLPLKGQPSPPNAVWPHPQQMTASNDVLYIRPHDLKIDSNIRSCDIIAKAI